MLGILCGMVILIPISDKLGRRKLLIVNAALGTVAQGAFLLFSDLNTYYLLMFLLGLSSALNPCIGYIYLLEMAPKKQYENTIVTLA